MFNLKQKIASALMAISVLVPYQHTPTTITVQSAQPFTVISAPEFNVCTSVNSSNTVRCYTALDPQFGAFASTLVVQGAYGQVFTITTMVGSAITTTTMVDTTYLNPDPTPVEADPYPFKVYAPVMVRNTTPSGDTGTPPSLP